MVDCSKEKILPAHKRLLGRKPNLSDMDTQKHCIFDWKNLFSLVWKWLWIKGRTLKARAAMTGNCIYIFFFICLVLFRLYLLPQPRRSCFLSGLLFYLFVSCCFICSWDLDVAWTKKKNKNIKFWSGSQSHGGYMNYFVSMRKYEYRIWFWFCPRDHCWTSVPDFRIVLQQLHIKAQMNTYTPPDNPSGKWHAVEFHANSNKAHVGHHLWHRPSRRERQRH